MTPTDRPAARRPGAGVRIGSLAGVPVYVRASWVVVAVVIAILLEPRIEDVQPGLGAGKYLAGLAFAVLLYLSILLHEFSHALMAQRVGLRVRSISLEFLGGSTEIEGEARTAGEEFKIAVVGPLTSIGVGLAALALLALDPQGLARLAVQGLAGANLVVGILNLIPGLPLDGGRVLRAAVWQSVGNMHQGTIVAAWGGRITALVAFGWPTLAQIFLDVQPDLFDYLFAFVIGAFLWTGATASMMNARIRRRLPALKARQLARRAAVVTGDLPIAEAVRRAQEAAAGGMVVASAEGHLVGVVNEAALLSVPEDRRPWVPVSSVSRSLDPGLILPADLAGEELIVAMSRTPASEYALVEPDGSLFGLLATADVDAAFTAGAGQ